MRIGVDGQSLQGRRTGIGRYTANLIDSMKEIAPQHKIQVIRPGRERVMRTDRRLYWQQYGLPRQTRILKTDLLHVTGFDAPMRKPCPVVMTVHDLIGMLFPKNLPPVSRQYWSKWLPFSIRRADAVIANSETTRQDIVRLVGLPAKDIDVAPLGVEACFQPRPPDALKHFRSRYHLLEPFILYVGTIEPRKGIDTLIDALAILARRLPHHLILAGQPGWRCRPIIDRISDHRLKHRVRVLDYVPEEDLPWLYAAAEAFALPSRYEGFGLPILEAMAAGTPVVCSNAAALPETAGSAALLVPPNDSQALASSLAAVIHDPSLAAQLREQGLIRAKTYSWIETAKATIGVYQRVFDRSRSGL